MPKVWGSRRPGANRFRRDFGWLLSVLGSARVGHAKPKCAGQTVLPHVVSDKFSKSGKLLEAGRGAKFCEPELQNALCRCMVTLCVVAEVVVVRVLCGLRNVLSWVVRVLCSLHERAGAEAKAAGCSLHLGDVDSFSSCFLPCMAPIDRHHLVSDVIDGRCTLHARLSTNSCGIGAWEFTSCGAR